MPPVEILEVSDGQDRGARFGLLGAEAMVGRGPTMDLMLTDPRVSRRHAVLRVQDGALTVTDLGSTAGTAVNGVPIRATTTLAVGDRIGLGQTTLTVLWTPASAAAAAVTADAASPAPAPPASPPPPPARTTMALRADRPPPRVVTPGLLLSGGALVAGLLGLAATAMPALTGEDGTTTFWTIEPTGVRVLAILAAVAAALAAGGWFVAERRGASPAARGMLAMGAAAGGGVLAGAPLMVAAAPTPGAQAGAALGATAAAGLIIAACAVGRVHTMAGPRRGPSRALPDVPAVLVALGGLGGLVAAAAAPMPWTTAGSLTVSGFDAAIVVGRWLVPLALAMTAACAITALVARLVERRTTAPAAAVALALTGLTLSFALAGATALTADTIHVGVVLALAGPAVGAVPCAAGALVLAASLRDPPPRSPSSTLPADGHPLG